MYRLAVVVGVFLAVGCTRGNPDDQPQPGVDSSMVADLGTPADLTAPPPDLVDPGPPPTLSSLQPTTGDWGTKVVLLGTHLANTTRVTYGGHSAAFAVVDDTRINAEVPQGAGTRPFVVETPAGSATTAESFHVPTRVTSFYPTTDVYANQPFSVYGYSLGAATAVKIGDTPAVSFKVTNDETLEVMIDPKTPSQYQHVTVTTPGGSATSQGTFFLRCTSAMQCPADSYCEFGTQKCH